MTWSPKNDWEKGWTWERLKETWNGKIKSRAWDHDPTYYAICDAINGRASALGLHLPRLVDLGCGGGIQLAALLERVPAFRYWGFDVHSGMIEYCNRIWPYMGTKNQLVAFEELDARTIKTDSRYKDFADFVIIRHVLEHHPLADMKLVLEGALRMAEHGVLVLFFKPPHNGTDVIGTRRKFYVNQFGDVLLRSIIHGAWPNAQAERAYFPKNAPGVKARNNQELWAIRRDA